MIAKPIQQLNRLAQISILQALTSSPDACALQLENMARNGTFPSDVAQNFRGVSARDFVISALKVLGAKLAEQTPDQYSCEFEGRHDVIRFTYAIDQAEYTSTLKVVPSSSRIIDGPVLATCANTARHVPVDALGKCAVSGSQVLRHLLVKSAISDRFALPQHTVICALSGQRVLSSEVETSDVTGQPVLRRLLKTSALSGRKAEPEHVGRCEFTQANTMLSELATSDVSGKRFRSDQAQRSELSGRNGHISEFITCAVTGRILLPAETERCAVTGQAVFPGMLEECAVSKKLVVPQELAVSSVSGRSALRQYLAFSSISGVQCLQEEAVRSDAGRFCTRMEAQTCAWTRRETHPDDLRICDLTGLPIHYSVATRLPPYRLAPLVEMLGGTRRAADDKSLWPDLAQLASAVSDGRCIIESAQASPDGMQLAVCAEQRKLLGLRTRCIGFVYSMADRAIIGRLAIGKRSNLVWVVAA